MNPATTTSPSALGIRRQPGHVVDFVERLIRDNLSVLVEPGQVVELRALDVEHEGRRYKALSGFYDDVRAMARDAAMLDGKARGIYWTLNPLRPEILDRSPNRLTPNVRAACDADVIARRWLPVDLDPARQADTNSTEDELSSALDRAERVWLHGRELGWGEPLAGVSGNGAHLLWPVDLQPEDDGLIRDALRTLSAEFSDERVKVDTTVFNASRIWRLYGTQVMKGPDSEERPHRRSVLLRKAWSGRC